MWRFLTETLADIFTTRLDTAATIANSTPYAKLGLIRGHLARTAPYRDTDALGQSVVYQTDERRSDPPTHNTFHPDGQRDSRNAQVASAHP